jgi:protein tyrosine phosphatase (PTP) superfamily phosphohydrolase (DUF442 family)
LPWFGRARRIYIRAKAAPGGAYRLGSSPTIIAFYVTTQPAIAPVFMRVGLSRMTSRGIPVATQKNFMTESDAIITSNLWRACRRTANIAALTTLLIVTSIASYCGIIQLLGNVHVVEDGQLYRSAQLNKNQFERVINEYSIRSILNLRGDNSGTSWYDDEIAISRSMSVTHFDYGIGARRLVTSQQIRAILKIVRDAPKPLLIHCQGGADRSGLVAALYVAEVEGKSADEAAQQLSLVYGHFPYLLSKTNAMDKSFWEYVEAHRSSR